MSSLPIVEARTRQQWRAWLAKQACRRRAGDADGRLAAGRPLGLK
jgi:hypothetical protein